ncbi:hypothetical protein ACFX16_034854 [Malus domestica]
MSLSNDDDRKVFGIVFRTPPIDSTGVADILQQSVLCGSRKYPVKKPFDELVRGSFSTSLHAKTMADRTYYSGSCTTTKELYNMVDVHLDAVFFPKCLEDVQIFQQQGWHYELNILSSLLMLNTSTKDMNFIQLHELVKRKTGGISIDPMTSSVRCKKDPCGHIVVRGKVMAGRAEDLFELGLGIRTWMKRAPSSKTPALFKNLKNSKKI